MTRTLDLARVRAVAELRNPTRACHCSRMTCICGQKAVLVRLLDAALDSPGGDDSLDHATDRASELIWLKPSEWAKEQ